MLRFNTTIENRVIRGALLFPRWCHSRFNRDKNPSIFLKNTKALCPRLPIQHIARPMMPRCKPGGGVWHSLTVELSAHARPSPPIPGLSLGSLQRAGTQKSCVHTTGTICVLCATQLPVSHDSFRCGLSERAAQLPVSHYPLHCSVNTECILPQSSSGRCCSRHLFIVSFSLCVLSSH